MEKYPIGIAESQIVAIMNGKRVLISTGSPVSIGEMPEITILGRVYKLESELLGLDIRKISESLKTDINALLGMDILKQFIFYVSHGIEAMIFSDYFINFKENMHELPVSNNSDLPLIDLRISGVSMKTVLDTGSRLSYLDASLVEGLRDNGTRETFYPGAGIFNTEVYTVPIEIKGKTMDIHFGKLPEVLMKDLYAKECCGILGADIFKYFNIQFCFKKNTIWLVDKGQSR